MRIVFVAFHGSVHTRRWVSFFAARGHDVHVVTCGGADVRDVDADGRRVSLTYAVHDLGSPRLGKIGYLLKLLRARRTIRSLDADVVHAHYATSYGLLALASGARPLAVTAHGDDVLISPRNRIMRAIVRRVLRAAELVTVPSHHMREAVAGLVAPHEPNVAVFQYGVETVRLARAGDAARTEAPRSDVLRVVCTRALLDLYRIDALLDALAELRRRGTPFVCDLVGDGPLRTTLEHHAESLGLGDAVTFHGHRAPGEVERMVAQADVYVSVAESDGVSLALLEALALGVVPVLSDIPANRDWIDDGVSGVLCPIDALAIAHAIERAAMIDRATAAASNQRTVLERADRDANLGACELLLDSLCGVSFDPTPAVPAADTIQRRGGDASDAA